MQRKLLEQGRIGSLEIKNRLIMAPMGTNLCNKDGFITPEARDFYEERARGGVGLIIFESTCVDYPRGRALPLQPSIDGDKYISGLAHLAEVVKSSGSRVAIQLTHAGHCAREEINGIQPVGPSAIRRPGASYEVPRELTIAEIHNTIDKFASAVLRAKQAGFDGVEIQGAHRYLINQFLSSAWNKRIDIYGGDIINRARFLSEIISAIREQVGRTFPVWCRLNAIEYGIKNGTNIKEAKAVARMAQEVGADAISVSCYGMGRYFMANMPSTPGSIVPLAGKIKKDVSVPVIAAGMINPEIGERVIHDGMIDFVVMGRTLIADPEVPNKIALDKCDEIKPCISCYNCIASLDSSDKPIITCAVNAAVGRERRYKIRKAAHPKRVAVIGGGAAGMEVARVAALRGHKVVLYEKEPQLGGQLILAAIPPGKSRIRALNRYLSSQLEKTGVRVNLGKEINKASFFDVVSDVVVIATGSSANKPNILDIDRSNVLSAADVLSDEVNVGSKVVVIGGNMVGCETAEFLAERGCQVTIIEISSRMATGVNPLARHLLLNRLREKNASMFTGVREERITDGGVIFTTKEQERKVIEADNIVLATGSKPNAGLFKAIDGRVPEIYLIGDCVEPRDIKAAIEEGYCVALAL
ncbi:FAD-dependent oxidoreductase [Chloroflexota bacterium]